MIFKKYLELTRKDLRKELTDLSFDNIDFTSFNYTNIPLNLLRKQELIIFVEGSNMKIIKSRFEVFNNI